MIFNSQTLQLLYSKPLNNLQFISPFKYLDNENTPSGTQKSQLLSLTKHTLRGVRILSSSKLNIYYISLYLKSPKNDVSPSLFVFFYSPI